MSQDGHNRTIGVDNLDPAMLVEVVRLALAKAEAETESSSSRVQVNFNFIFNQSGGFILMSDKADPKTILSGGDVTFGNKSGDVTLGDKVGGHKAARDVNVAGGNLVVGDARVTDEGIAKEVTTAVELLKGCGDSDLSASEKDVIRTALKQVRGLDAEGKTVQEMHAMLEELWLGDQQEKFKTPLQKFVSVPGVLAGVKDLAVLGKVLAALVA